MNLNKCLALLIGALVFAAASTGSAMGLLIPNVDGAGPLDIESHRVSIEIQDNVAVTHVDQVFRNSSGTQLEATFIFPLPEGATVHDFALYINGTRVEGEILDSVQAREVYEGIVRQVRDPGLVEYIDGRLFQASIFPVPANGTQRVELEFAQVLELEGSLHRLVYPLRTGRTAATTLTDFTLTVDVLSSIPIRAVYSPTHLVDVIRETDLHAVVGLEQMNADLEQDFVLYLSTSDDDVGMTLFTFDEDGEDGEDGYFLMLISPRLESEALISAKDVTFVVDTSGSMAGEMLEQAQDTLRYCINQLGANDRFNIVRFSTTARTLFDDLTQLDEQAQNQAMEFIDEMRAAGGTAIESALNTAVAQNSDPSRPHYIIFITDGLPTVGETQSNLILENVEVAFPDNARLFSFGVGYDVDSTLLDLMAENHGGIADYVRPGEDIELAVSTLYDRIAYPILTDVALDFGDADAHDLYPIEIPDLFAGHQVVLAGRFRNHIESEIRMTGTTNSESRVYSLQEDFSLASTSDGNDFLPQLWATRKIGFLVDQIRRNGEDPELRDEVMHLGLRYGLVTPYTSYLAVDDSEFVNPGWGGGEWREWEGEEPPVFGTTTSQNGWGGNRERRGDDEDSAADAWEIPVAEETGVFNLAAPSGEAAIETALEGQRLQEIDFNDRHSPVQNIGQRVLALDTDGVWRERDEHTNSSAQRVQVQYLSDAYFRVLEIRPDLDRLLAVGDSVEFNLNDDVILEINRSTGFESLDAETEAMLMY